MANQILATSNALSKEVDLSVSLEIDTPNSPFQVLPAQAGKAYIIKGINIQKATGGVTFFIKQGTQTISRHPLAGGAEVQFVGGGPVLAAGQALVVECTGTLDHCEMTIGIHF